MTWLQELDDWLCAPYDSSYYCRLCGTIIYGWQEHDCVSDELAVMEAQEPD